MSAMKLQKLVYYSQAWHLTWDDAPLFTDQIEAWANGPVIPNLYQQHRRQFTVEAETFDGNSEALDGDERESVDAVLAFYSKWNAHELSELTHRERPWMMARERDCLTAGQRGNAEILPADMAEYYGGLVTDGEERS
jgi:uncharacterized phage-associated protein